MKSVVYFCPYYPRLVARGTYVLDKLGGQIRRTGIGNVQAVGRKSSQFYILLKSDFIVQDRSQTTLDKLGFHKMVDRVWYDIMLQSKRGLSLTRHCWLQVAMKVESGVGQLVKAEKTQRSSRLILCIMILIVAVIVMLLVVVFKKLLL